MTRRILAGVLLGAVLAGAQTQPSSSALLDQAKAQAAEGQRAVFAIFHASW
ncbi:MAG TPA: hypothetical protein VE959_17820 [Bryobacteraceae bacterium]|nr:hypothetical protein [Bryobacteraceae bacterium]